MDPKFQTSFIPKKTATSSVPLRERGAVGMITFILLVILILTLVAAGAVFAWETLLKNQISSKYQEILQAKKELDTPITDEIAKLDARIKSSKIILSSHLSPSILFPILEKLTLKSVQFSDFSFTADKTSVTVTMKGIAKDFSSVALQSDKFSDPLQNPYFANPIFSDFKLDQNGNVSFTLTANVKSQDILFKNRASGLKLPETNLINTGNTMTPATTTATTTKSVSKKKSSTNKTAAIIQSAPFLKKR